MGKKDKEKKKAAKAGKAALPEPLQTQRDYVLCGPLVNAHTATATSASQYLPLGVDNAWDFDAWAADFDIQVQELSAGRLVFDLVGADPSLANALRRILISEVPTVAIEHVFVVNNTSLIQDEVLSHRLGLVPLAIDPDRLAWCSGEEAASETNTVVFRLNAACRKAPDGSLVNDKVYSRDLVWLPEGSEMPDETGCRFGHSQSEQFAAPPRDVEQDILLAKLRPGQCIELEAHAVKGIGREHAKWSPVATAWYRLHPEVVLLQPVSGDDAQELAAAVPGLFSLQDGQLVVGDARQHEDKLERVRRLLEADKWAEALQLRKRKSHFIFTVESTGCVPPVTLLQNALDILAQKAERLAGRL